MATCILEKYIHNDLYPVLKSLLDIASVSLWNIHCKFNLLQLQTQDSDLTKKICQNNAHRPVNKASLTYYEGNSCHFMQSIKPNAVGKYVLKQYIDCSYGSQRKK